MAHFAAEPWPDKYGPIASFRTISHAAAVSQTTLYTTLTGDDGTFRITAVGRTRTVGTGANQAWDLDLEVNNGTADTTLNFLDSIDGLVANSPKMGSTVYYLPSGSTIKYTTNVNGTNTTPAVLDIEIIVERV